MYDCPISLPLRSTPYYKATRDGDAAPSVIPPSEKWTSVAYCVSRLQTFCLHFNLLEKLFATVDRLDEGGTRNELHTLSTKKKKPQKKHVCTELSREMVIPPSDLSIYRLIAWCSYSVQESFVDLIIDHSFPSGRLARSCCPVGDAGPTGNMASGQCPVPSVSVCQCHAMS